MLFRAANLIDISYRSVNKSCIFRFALTHLIGDTHSPNYFLSPLCLITGGLDNSLHLLLRPQVSRSKVEDLIIFFDTNGVEFYFPNFL